MPKIVQFTHPGHEHGPEKNNPNHKNWNAGAHKRKFLHATGRYVQGNQLHSGELLFWGEWEPPSVVNEFASRPTWFHPRWLHRPYLPEVIPDPHSDGASLQNTDPYVFDGPFKYAICKQFKSRTGRPTQLANLDRGSIVLFGSTGNQNKPNAFFQLDTVFVVGDYLEYDVSDPAPLSLPELRDYHTAVFQMAFPNPTKNSLKLRLYFGATYDNPFEGMYSFSPAQVFNGQSQGFPRVALKDLPYLTNNLNAAPKISGVSIDQSTIFWEEIRTISREQGCVEGVHYDFWRREELG
jgi:hypothetical protein